MPYVNPYSVVLIGGFFPVIGALAGGTRFYLRRNKKLPVSIDDWLCLPALVGFGTYYQARLGSH